MNIIVYISFSITLYTYRSLQVYQRSYSQVEHRVLSDLKRVSLLKLSDKILPGRSESESILKHGYYMLIHFIHEYYCIYRPWQPLTYLYFPYCILLIYFSFTKIRMFLYARIYWLAEFGVPFTCCRQLPVYDIGCVRLLFYVFAKCRANEPG
jgi:hypothetical protein